MLAASIFRYNQIQEFQVAKYNPREGSLGYSTTFKHVPTSHSSTPFDFVIPRCLKILPTKHNEEGSIWSTLNIGFHDPIIW